MNELHLRRSRQTKDSNVGLVVVVEIEAEALALLLDRDRLVDVQLDHASRLCVLVETCTTHTQIRTPRRKGTTWVSERPEISRSMSLHCHLRRAPVISTRMDSGARSHRVTQAIIASLIVSRASERARAYLGSLVVIEDLVVGQHEPTLAPVLFDTSATALGEPARLYGLLRELLATSFHLSRSFTCTCTHSRG